MKTNKIIGTMEQESTHLSSDVLDFVQKISRVLISS